MPTLSVQADRLRALGRHRRRGGQHPRHVRQLRHGRRDVLDHRAALRGPHERARRRPALAGPRRRRHHHRRVALRLHRRPAGGARACGGGVRADPGDPAAARGHRAGRPRPLARVATAPRRGPHGAGGRARGGRAGRGARVPGRVAGVRRHPGATRRQPHGRARRDRRAGRAQRLGQDDAHQRDQRPLRRRPGPGHARRRDADGAAGARDRPAGRLPHVPDPAALRPLHRARQRGAGGDVRARPLHAAPGPRRGVRLAGVHRPRPAGGRPSRTS